MGDASATGESWADLVRGGLLALTVLVLDAVVLSAWLGWLVAVTGADVRSLPLGLVAVVGAVAYGLGLWLLGSGVGMGQARLASLGVAGVTLLVLARLVIYPMAALLDLSWMTAFGAEVLRFLGGQVNGPGLLTATVVYMWWRGSEIAAEALPVVVPRSALSNVLSLAALALFSHWIFPVDLGVAVLWVFPLSLLALALARLEEVSGDASGVQTPLGRSWLAILLVTIGLCGGIGLILSSPFGRAVGRLVASVFRPFTDLLLAAMLFLVGSLYWLFSLLFTPLLQAIMDAFLKRADRPILPQNPGLQRLLDQLRSGLYSLPPWLLLAVRGLLVLLVVLIVGGWLAGVLRRYNDARQRPAGATTRSEFGWRRAGSDLAAAARDALGAARRALDRLRAGEDVRGLYARLLRLEVERGKPRAMAQTPYEYEPTPADDLPSAAPDVARLTDAYVRARYGGQGVAGEELRGLRAAWLRIRRAGREG